MSGHIKTLLSRQDLAQRPDEARKKPVHVKVNRKTFKTLHPKQRKFLIKKQVKPMIDTVNNSQVAKSYDYYVHQVDLRERARRMDPPPTTIRFSPLDQAKAPVIKMNSADALFMKVMTEKTNESNFILKNRPCRLFYMNGFKNLILFEHLKSILKLIELIKFT